MTLPGAIRALIDRVTARPDTHPEATLGGCMFTQAEIDAAPPVEVVDVDEDD